MNEILALVLMLTSPDFREVDSDRYAVRIAAERNLGKNDLVAFAAGRVLMDSPSAHLRQTGLRLTRKATAKWPVVDRVRFVWWFVNDTRSNDEMEEIGIRELDECEFDGPGWRKCLNPVDAAIDSILTQRHPMRERERRLIRSQRIDEDGTAWAVFRSGPDYPSEREWALQPFRAACRQKNAMWLHDWFPALKVILNRR